MGLLGAGCGGPKMTCMTMAGLAVIHASFAVYLQRAIVRGIEKEGKEVSSHKERAKQVVHILLYDVGFCIYMFIYIGSWGYSFYALVSLSCPDGSGGEDVEGAGVGGTIAAVLLIFFEFCAVSYLCAWYSCQCVGGAIEKKKVPVPALGGKPAPGGAAPAQQAMLGRPAPMAAGTGPVPAGGTVAQPPTAQQQEVSAKQEPSGKAALNSAATGMQALGAQAIGFGQAMVGKSGGKSKE
eukprot:CAMPEP_0176092144 /NCGR_PEP_ID=MMETSP0120_2-20121206/46157_1 /TAXON_ID=160619 /ORGANISM="Kryptoperidinium foliaceum, Strain CCMP 1326" /LENGTH=237 /DNA_ID=CAMNT_0017426047 /DNA_START=243 /DNA_END=956 /DNA_ORIENTATION=-